MDRVLPPTDVKVGDRVVAIAPKSPLHFSFFYACWKLGLIAVPVCESLGDLEMSFIIRDSDPVFILVDAGFDAKVKANAGDIPVIDWQTIPVHAEAGKKNVPNTDIPLDSVATLIYTSGSTGMPKGVMLTHRIFG